MNRVSEVIDCWYDSGAMPFAQWGYPHKEGSVEALAGAYPADFICEAIDQTRGWFYTLMTIGTLVFDESSYKTVLCLGHILDKDGRKMSKHLGNVLQPMPLMDQHGADAVRWYMLAAGSPWSARRVGHDALSDVVRKTLLTYWNTVSFFSLYAHAANFEFAADRRASEVTMDRWIISELNQLVTSVDLAFEEFNSQEVGRLLATFIDDLSNWYVRRSRRRFWDGDTDALSTLFTSLKTLTQLMSPMVPFITEHVWQVLIRQGEATEVESVHLTSFPTSDASLVDEKLSSEVALSRRLVELGRAARAESKIKIRQPLSRALVSAAGYGSMSQEIRDQITDELNVLQLDDLSTQGADLVSVLLKANFRNIGARYGADVQAIASAITQADPNDLVSRVRAAGPQGYEINFGQSHESGEKVATITIDDLVVTETPKEGWSVASHAGESVALDLELTPELLQAGLMREVIRTIQEARKSSDFDISDRIHVRWSAGADVAAAIARYESEIAAEVLALSIAESKDLASAANELGLSLEITRANS